VENAYAVRYLLPEASAETFYLFFPDPWPKRRHHRRRIVTTDFLDSIHRALTADGILRIATDQSDYFNEIQRLVREHSGFTVVDAEETALPMTKFERRFASAGAPIHRLALRKVSPVA
jgi:tRNA (guanine-N7-)-methyltransferase